MGTGGAVAVGRQGGASHHVLTFAPHFQQVRPLADVHLYGQAFLYQKYFLMRPFETPRMMLEMFFLSLKSRPFGFIFHVRVWCTVCVQTCKDPCCGWPPSGALYTVVMKTNAWRSCQARPLCPRCCRVNVQNKPLSVTAAACGVFWRQHGPRRESPRGGTR